MDRFVTTGMGEASLILGITVTRDYDKGTLTSSQSAYLQNILERFGMLKGNTVHTPGYGPELSNEHQEDKRLGAREIKLYQTIVRSLLYLAQVIRYRICCAVNQLARARSKPSAVRMTTAKQLLRYLKGLPDLAITYKRDRSPSPVTQTPPSRRTRATASQQRATCS